MGLFSSDFWDEYYGINGYEKPNKRNNGVPSDLMGGHSDRSIDQRMSEKNFETSGSYYAKVSGDTGELELSSVLKSLPDCYHIIDDVLLKTKKGSTQLDHIVVSPFGLFVIETKNHKGMIFGDCCGQVWTQVLNGRGHFKLYSPVLQNSGHIRHLSQQIKVPATCMQGCIVFTNRDANLSNVNCPFCFNVDQLYSYITHFHNVIFNNKQVEEIIRRIDAVDTNSYMNRRKHVDYVSSLKNKRGY